MFNLDFKCIIAEIESEFARAPVIPAKSWQSVEAPQGMPEIFNYSFTVALEGEELDIYREAINPNLPWADHHFERERVSGDPINPGWTWRDWPWANSANTHRRDSTAGNENPIQPQFDHSYAERYWPKFAGQTPGGVLDFTPDLEHINQGYRFPYGDLDDLVEILTEDPLTRQAYLPVWFPEDLAAAKGHKRVPCTLGYHFILRENHLHIIYYIRSCDFYRHFRDDVYLTIRLLLWVLQQCKLLDLDGNWDEVKPGTFTMHITSLHLFENDRKVLLGK